jgi:hypothetical protein
MEINTFGGTGELLAVAAFKRKDKVHGGGCRFRSV